MSHQCPISGCTQALPDELLMCRPHWFMVPNALRKAVYGAYGLGKGLGSLALYRAQDAAIRAVEVRLGARESA